MVILDPLQCMCTAVEVMTPIPRGMVDEEQTGGGVESGEALWSPCAPAIARINFYPTATSDVHSCFEKQNPGIISSY